MNKNLNKETHEFLSDTNYFIDYMLRDSINNNKNEINNNNNNENEDDKAKLNNFFYKHSFSIIICSVYKH